MFSPYVPDHLGGGERYFFSVAEYLSRNHQVCIALPRKTVSEEQVDKIRRKYETYFQLNLQHVRFIPSPLGRKTFFLKKLWWTKQFDVLYYLTDGSLFFSLAKTNILHIQFPFTTKLRGVLGRMKLRNWNVKNTNSSFTKSVIERTWKTKIDVVHNPFVDTKVFMPASKKSKVILHVGRFFSHLHTKRQDILVKAFKDLVDEHPKELKGWKLVLIGGVEDEVYAQKIAKMADGYPIKIIHDASLETLKGYYSVAKIYWHATGFGVDEYINPMFVEHFGISTIEAMASGDVPVVINKGGQQELIEHGVNGFLWNEIDALKEKTLACITNQVDMKSIAQKARESVDRFSPQVFYEKLNEMIGETNQSVREISGNVSLIIPNYNGRTLLEKNLPSVFECMREGDELVIVDDASTDDTVEWMIKHFRLQQLKERGEFSELIFKGEKKNGNKTNSVTLIKNKKNERFGAACNKGVKFCANDLVFVINTDVRPKPDVLHQLVPYFLHATGDSGHIFAVGCLEVEHQSRGKDIQGGKNVLWFQRGMFVHKRAEEFSTGETAWVSGGSGMYDKQKWNELGGFDVRFYPAYWEDIDLSFRARQRGWKVLFDSQAIVEHRHESTNSSAFGQQKIEIMSFKNALTFTWMHARFFQRLSFLLWLPYHLILTSIKTRGAFIQGFWLFLTSSKIR